MYPEAGFHGIRVQNILGSFKWNELMDKKTKAVIEEAIRELNISSEPDTYHKIKRLARKYIKKQIVEPIDIINWPKGCLMVGLMNQATRLMDSDAADDKAMAVRAMGEVQIYLDRWIKKGSQVSWVDDCLAGQALLMLADEFKLEEENSFYGSLMSAADKMMQFLYAHDKDAEGALPYRPGHKDGKIFADSVGMVLPFSLMYGIRREDEDAMELGMNLIDGFMRHGIEFETGLPWHAYSIMGAEEGARTDSEKAKLADSDCDTTSSAVYGDFGWGRAIGWIMYGIGASLADMERAEANRLSIVNSPVFIHAKNKLNEYRKQLSETALCYRCEDGLFGSMLKDATSKTDTSASAMILYGIYGKIGMEVLEKYITDDGRVMGAQGECLGLGVYSDIYDSYPWSVGMALNL